MGNSRAVPQAVLDAAYDAVEATKTKKCPRGNRVLAAKQLGISRITLIERLRIREAGRSAEAIARSKPSDGDYLADLAGMLRDNPDLSRDQYVRQTKLPEATRFKERYGSWGAFREAATRAAGITPETLQLRERQRQQDRLRELRLELTKAHRELNRREDLRQSIFNLTAEPVRVPGWALDKSRPSKDSELPMLHASDWQIGEVVSAARIGGFNEFNWSIAQDRIKTLCAKTVELSFSHRGKKRYPGIYYLRGGDMISGQIHPDLVESNDLQSCEAARNLVTVESWLLRELRKAFGRVHVKSVPGNHGRSTDKPRTKWNVGTNFDILTHHWLEDVFRGDTNISFDAPASGDACFSVYGYNFVMTHGDRMGSRGGEGFLGAAATIVRGMKRTFEYYATLGRMIDYIMCGHFHVALSLEHGYSNGCLPGYTEYAQGYRMRPHPPSQNLLYVHQHYGVADMKPVILGAAPKITEISDDPFKGVM